MLMNERTQTHRFDKNEDRELKEEKELNVREYIKSNERRSYLFFFEWNFKK